MNPIFRGRERGEQTGSRPDIRFTDFGAVLFPPDRAVC